MNPKGVPALHDELTRLWHVEALESWRPPEEALSALIARQHLANFELWHTEDEARVPEASDADLARIKRRIDQTNQRRNDLSEQVDRTLLLYLVKLNLPHDGAELHSESPGLIVDRLSILALKIFHTREEIARAGASFEHAERNRGRLATLEQQRSDLDACLVCLWADTLSGRKRFKLYQQLKMYNDPTLNPAVYRKGLHATN